jgi:hypothetical protein
MKKSYIGLAPGLIFEEYRANIFFIPCLAQVVLFDVEAEQVARALKLIAAELRQFELDGLLKGDISAEDQVSIS